MDFDSRNDQEQLRDAVQKWVTRVHLRAPQQLVREGVLTRRLDRTGRTRLCACTSLEDHGGMAGPYRRHSRHVGAGPWIGDEPLAHALIAGGCCRVTPPNVQAAWPSGKWGSTHRVAHQERKARVPLEKM